MTTTEKETTTIAEITDLVDVGPLGDIEVEKEGRVTSRAYGFNGTYRGKDVRVIWRFHPVGRKMEITTTVGDAMISENGSAHEVRNDMMSPEALRKALDADDMTDEERDCMHIRRTIKEHAQTTRTDDWRERNRRSRVIHEGLKRHPDMQKFYDEQMGEQYP